MPIRRVLLGLLFFSNSILAAPRIEQFGNISLHFEPNPSEGFVARTPRMNLYVTAEGTVMVLNGKSIVRMKLPGATEISGLDKLPGISNYFLGNDPKKWRTNVPHFARVESKEVYPGIDVVYYGNGKQIEYDFTVAPGADPDQIRLAFEGPTSVKLNQAGDIVLTTDSGDLIQKKPRVCQEANGRKIEIEARYLLKGNQATFELARYDRHKPLTIDPMLVYSTFLGGSTYEIPSGIAIDASGAAYISGSTQSVDFPVQGALQPALHGSMDAFVIKLAQAGSAILYSTYLGGALRDGATQIAVDSTGAAYITGYTQSTDFPVQGGIQSTLHSLHGFENAFVAKLSPSGAALIYSSYLGGSGQEIPGGIAIDSFGAAYVTGGTTSVDFPTQNPLQPANHSGGRQTTAFISKFNAAGSALVYSTYLGGSGSDTGVAIATDANGAAYITGNTGSRDFPTRNPIQAAPSNTLGNTQDVFIAELNSAGNALVYSTYLGGKSLDLAHAIAVDSKGAAYVTGSTQSSDFPLQSPFQTALKGGQDAFVTKIAPFGSALVYSSYLGGSDDLKVVVTSSVAAVNGQETGLGIAVDANGAAYIVGQTYSTDFPQVNPLEPASLGLPDAFIAKVNPPGTALIYSTYFGGGSLVFYANTENYVVAGDSAVSVATDSFGSVYVLGSTYLQDLPIINAAQPSVNRPPPPTNITQPQPTPVAFAAKISEATDIPLTKVTISSQAGTILVDGFVNVNLPNPHDFLWAPGSIHTVSVTGNMPAGVRGAFVGWSDGAPAAHRIIAPSVATTYTANFNAQYLITIAPLLPLSGLIPGPGSVSLSPASPDGYYNAGTSVQVAATPNVGWSLTALTFAPGGSNSNVQTLSSPTALAVTQPGKLQATFVTSRTGTLTASPNPIPVCDGSGAGATTLTWNATGVLFTEVHVNSPDGPLFGRTGPSGTHATGKWVGNNTNFYLQDVSNGLPLTPANTLAVLTVELTGCSSTANIIATPDPAMSCFGNAGKTTLNWNAPGATIVEVHLGSPTGALFARSGSSGSQMTGNWVSDGLVFYLQDVSGGVPGVTVATTTVHLTSVGCSTVTGSLSIATPIQVCDGTNAVALPVTWNASSTAQIIEIHLGAPDGALFARSGSQGTKLTGKWVTDGTTFYLQNVTYGVPATPANTIAIRRVSVQTSGCNGRTAAMSITPNPVIACIGPPPPATVAWQSTGTSALEVHIGSPGGPLFGSAGSSGQNVTGPWLGPDAVFFLQDVSNGLPLTVNNTLAIVSPQIQRCPFP
jgi:hypothetical protein